MTPAEVDGVIEHFHQDFLRWREATFAERAELMKAAARILHGNKEEYVRLMAEEMSKPLAGGRAEAENRAWACDFCADNAEGFLASEPVETDASHSFIAYEPLGMVLAVMPWNFPF